MDNNETDNRNRINVAAETKTEKNENRSRTGQVEKRTLGEKTKMMETHVLTESTKNVPGKLIDGVAKISSKGQVVIPVNIRSALGIQEGDQLHFVLENDKLVIEPVHLLSAQELFGLFDEPDDNGNFVLELHVARDERGENLVRNNWLENKGLEKGE